MKNPITDNVELQELITLAATIKGTVSVIAHPTNCRGTVNVTIPNGDIDKNIDLVLVTPIGWRLVANIKKAKELLDDFLETFQPVKVIKDI